MPLRATIGIGCDDLPAPVATGRVSLRRASSPRVSKLAILLLTLISFWQAGKVELAVQRMEYAWLDAVGGELLAAELLAELSPLMGGA